MSDMFLNIIQLAESLGVEERVVDGWIKNEGLPCVRDCGRLLFDRAQVAAWAAQRGLGARAGFLASARPAGIQARSLDHLLKAGGVWRDVAAADAVAIIERVVTSLPGATPAVRTMLAQRVRQPDGITWAPVGHGLALPHLRSSVALGREAGVLAMLFLKDSLALANSPEDGVPVNRLLFFVAPSPRAHLEILAQLSSALTRRGLRQLVQDAAPDEQLLSALAAGVTGDQPDREVRS